MAKRLFTISICLLLSSCASVVRTPLTEDLHQDVTVLGRSDYRQWGDAIHSKIFSGVHNMAELEERYGGIARSGNVPLVRQ